MCFYTKNGKTKDEIVILGEVLALDSFSVKKISAKINETQKVAGTLVSKVLIDLVQAGQLSKRGSNYKVI